MKSFCKYVKSGYLWLFLRPTLGDSEAFRTANTAVTQLHNKEEHKYLAVDLNKFQGHLANWICSMYFYVRKCPSSPAVVLLTLLIPAMCRKHRTAPTKYRPHLNVLLCET